MSVKFVVRAAAALGFVWVLSACEQQGLSGLKTEWDRVRTGPYQVVSANYERAVVSALGNQVAIEPAEGFCLAEESIETSRRSAFALIGDCVLEKGGADGPRGARGELNLPRGVPGIITVSISGDPGFSQSGSHKAALDSLAEFLGTREGRRMLGRSGSVDAVEIVETRRIGNGVYVLVDDGGDTVVPLLNSRFWRAFLALNNRMTVVTVSGFTARPLGEDQMLKYLVNQVQTLEVANAVPVNEEPTIQIASVEAETTAAPALETASATGVDRIVENEPVRITELEPESVIVVTRESAEPPLWPVPPRRPRRVDEAEVQRVDVSDTVAGSIAVPAPAARPTTVNNAAEELPATRFAPPEAPAAPRRPVQALSVDQTSRVTQTGT